MPVTFEEFCSAFIDWQVDPAPRSVKGSQADWCKARGLHEASVRRWKRDPRFKDALQARLDELNVSPDRIQQVVDAMFVQATEGNTKAAELYLRFVERLQPPKVVVERSAAELSDEELAAALESVKLRSVS